MHTPRTPRTRPVPLMRTHIVCLLHVSRFCCGLTVAILIEERDRLAQRRLQVWLVSRGCSTIYVCMHAGDGRVLGRFGNGGWRETTR